jgi:hypothetical protein
VSKEAVKAMMKKRRARRAKEQKDAFRGPYSITHAFITEMDEVTENAQSFAAWSMEMEWAAKRLHKRMRTLDPDVDVKVMWNREGEITENSDWKTLRVDGVKITWSTWYIGKHPFNDKEKYIDIGQLFIEGYFD